MERTIAVLIDFENLATGCEKEGLGRFDLRVVMRRMKDKGRILVARAYADWGQWSRMKQDLFEQGVAMQELSTRGNVAKNRADMALCVDAMELAFTRDYLDTFVILSGDSDFTPLVMRLKELNKSVIGCGTRGSTSQIFANICDEFYYYETLQREVRAERAVETGPHAEGRRVTDAAFDLLLETLENHQRDEGAPVHASVLKSSMKRKVPTFSEVELGYRTFARFLDAAADRSLITLRTDERAGGYRVELATARENEAAHAPRAERYDRGERNERGERPERNEARAERAERLERAERAEMAAQRAPERPPERAAPERARAERAAPDGGDSDERVGPPATGVAAVMEEEGFELGGLEARQRLLELFVDVAAERAGKGKKCTTSYVVGELLRLRRSERLPLIPREVKGIMRAVQASGVLLDAHGHPAYKANAPYEAPTDPRALHAALAGLVRRVLSAHDVDPADPELIALIGPVDQGVVADVAADTEPAETAPVVEARPAARTEERPAERTGERSGRSRRGGRRGRRGGRETEDLDALFPPDPVLETDPAPADPEDPGPGDEALAPSVAAEPAAVEPVVGDAVVVTTAEAQPVDDEAAAAPRPARRRAPRKKAAPKDEPVE